MRKIYSLVLMAAALLVGTNAWATLHNTENVGVDEAKIVIDNGTPQFGTIYEAFDAVTVDHPATITLLKDVELTKTIFIYDNDDELNGNDGDEHRTPKHRKVITLDLGIFTISSGLLNNFDIFKGKLVVIASKNENPKKQGTIKNTHKTDGYTLNATEKSLYNTTLSSFKGDEVGNVFRLAGHRAADKVQNPSSYPRKWVEKWTELIIGENVRIEATGLEGTTGSNGIAIDSYSNTYLPYAYEQTSFGSSNNELYTYQRYYNGTSYKDYGQGVEVTMESGSYLYATKYGIKVNGNITYQDGNIPYVHVKSGAEVASHATNTKSTPIYSSGWGRFDLEGYLHGNTGVYIKGGVVNITNATIKSDNTDYSGPADRGGNSGIKAGGSAIVIDTDPGYVGDQEVTISGNSTITSTSGYAVEQTKNDGVLPSGTYDVESITITGGTFTGGTQGCITLEEDPETPITVTISGGTYSGDIDDIISHMDNDQAVQPVVVDDGQGGTTTVYVVSDLPSGTSYTDHTGATFEYDDDTQLVNLTANTAVPANSTATVDVLKINGAYTITVPDGSTLNAKQVILNADAKIIVEAGGKLVVNGVNGIISSVATNIELHAEEGKPSIFLLNPNVESNNTPKATVEFVSKSYRVSSSNRVFQRFGIPTGAAVESITSTPNTVETAFSSYDYAAGNWNIFGILNNQTVGYSELNPNDLNNPFGYYQMLSNTPTPGTIFTFTGSLVGNTATPLLSYVPNDFNGFANSYMGYMNIEAMLSMLDGYENEAVYTYRSTGQDTYTWEAVTSLENNGYTVIEPLQAFVIWGDAAHSTSELNYTNMVWNHRNDPVSAPKRVAQNIDMTSVRILVSDNTSADKVSLFEDSRFTASMDKGEAYKYMNDNYNLYVTDEKKMSVFATDNLNNSYLGFSSLSAGTYTISFENVNNEIYGLMDLETNVYISIQENKTYQFSVSENYVNDYRFKIVGRHEMPTDVENVDQENIYGGGIYTISGQYVGEMNIWNTLPAGLYIVNGEKKIK